MYRYLPQTILTLSPMIYAVLTTKSTQLTAEGDKEERAYHTPEYIRVNVYNSHAYLPSSCSVLPVPVQAAISPFLSIAIKALVHKREYSTSATPSTISHYQPTVPQERQNKASRLDGRVYAEDTLASGAIHFFCLRS